jgi:hypothetical protein
MTHIYRTALIPLLAAACTLGTTAAAQEPVTSPQEQAAKAKAEIASMQPTERVESQENKRKDEALELVSVDTKLIKGKPYSADSTTDIVQTLSDGNRIQRHTISKFYRDSQGRTRREQTFGNVDLSNPGPHEVKTFLDDPVAGTAYVLDPGEKTALKLRRSRKFLDEREAENIPEIPSLPRLNEGRDIVKRDLGKKTIDGVECTGTQQTITIPSGQIGNEQPIAIVTETWYAPGIGAVVQFTTTDPRFGQTTYQLHNIQLTEQPLQLFEPPASYKLQASR